VAAVEFGLILVPFCLLILGGLELAHQIYVRSVVSGALTDVGRRAGVEDPMFAAAGATLEERIENTLRDQIEPIVSDSAQIRISTSNFYDFSGIGNPEKLMTDHNANGAFDIGDCWEDLNENGRYDTDTGRAGIGGADDVVFYRVEVTQNHLFPIQAFIGLSDSYTVVAETAVRNQPYANQKTPPVLCVETS